MAPNELSRIVEDVYGDSGYRQIYTRAYFNWVHLLHLIDPKQGKFDQTKFDQLDSILSEAHWSSIYLLQEWWHGHIQSRKISATITDGILTTAMAPLMDESDLKMASTQVRQHVSKFDGNGMPWNEALDGKDASSYNRTLFELWTSEFCLFGPNIIDPKLSRNRREAAISAANQRIAWSCFKNAIEGSGTIKSSIGQDQRKFTFPLRATVEVCPWLQPKKDELPFFLWDVAKQCTVRVVSLPARPSYIAVSHTWGRWKLQDSPPATIEGVPWPVPKNSRFDVAELPAILKSNRVTTPYMWIDLFCIPQDKSNDQLQKVMNDEIARQGEIFRNADGAVIWFNDVEDWLGLESAVLWLAGTFLKNSSINGNGEASPLNSWLQALNTSASNPTGLFEKYDYTDIKSVVAATPSGWFSSLWTLQEACLRPDMLLVDRNWRLFAVGPDNLQVTLDNLIALVNENELYKYKSKPAIVSEKELQMLPTGTSILDSSSEAILNTLLPVIDPVPSIEDYQIESMPRGAAELRVIVNKFEMQQILNANQATILALANQRYCKHSRAQAIMSVIGVTEWYQRHVEQTGSRPSEESLTLGRYPFAFVNDARKKLGAQFFNSSGSGFEICPRDIYDRHEGGKIVSVKPIGSMMPFAQSDMVPKSVSKLSERAKDHPSVATWELLPDGTCIINQASVIASSSRKSPENGHEGDFEKLRVRVWTHKCGEKTMKKDVNLGQFLQENGRDFNMHAVILCHGSTTLDCSGIFLQEIVHAGTQPLALLEKTRSLARYQPPTKLLLRIGIWTLHEFGNTPELPVCRDVDWRIL